MAACDWCGLEMTDNVGCTGPTYDDFRDGVPRARIPVDFEWCDQQGHCGDCGAPAEALHHPGCDVERCPLCGAQAISCGCARPEDS